MFDRRGRLGGEFFWVHNVLCSVVAVEKIQRSEADHVVVVPQNEGGPFGLDDFAVAALEAKRDAAVADALEWAFSQPSSVIAERVAAIRARKGGV